MVLVDEGTKSSNVGVHTWVVSVSATNTPGNDTGELAVDDQWATGITLAGVLSAAADTTADHLVGDLVTGWVVPLIASCPADDLDGDSLELGR